MSTSGTQPILAYQLIKQARLLAHQVEYSLSLYYGLCWLLCNLPHSPYIFARSRDVSSPCQTTAPG